MQQRVVGYFALKAFFDYFRLEYETHQCLKLKPDKFESEYWGCFNMRYHTALYKRPQMPNWKVRFFKKGQKLKILTNKLIFLYLSDLFHTTFNIVETSFDYAALRNLAEN